MGCDWPDQDQWELMCKDHGKLGMPIPWPAAATECHASLIKAATGADTANQKQDNAAPVSTASAQLLASVNALTQLKLAEATATGTAAGSAKTSQWSSKCLAVFVNRTTENGRAFNLEERRKLLQLCLTKDEKLEVVYGGAMELESSSGTPSEESFQFFEEYSRLMLSES